ncbi:MAG: ChbG/HpnK family deacetylase [Candidatus Promineifilaceae bacterium]|nr:ChbG/HpnK family deacetylase [Candidatus Promineifilaceae bacterium]
MSTHFAAQVQTQPTRLIINADDFGLSPGVNSAVRQLHQQSRLTSASLMVNSPWSEEALTYARNNSDLQIGVHLNLTTHRPLLPPEQVTSLVTGEGAFFSISAFLVRLLAGRIDLDQVKAEMRAQIEACYAAGITPAHIDSHMHLHALTTIGALVAELAQAYDIAIVRNPDPAAVLLPAEENRPLTTAVRSPLSQLIHTTWRLAQRENPCHSGNFTQAEKVIYLRWCAEHDNAFTQFVRCLDQLPGETAEVIVHPAVADHELPAFSSYVDGRQLELALLIDDRFTELINQGRVVLANGKVN